MRSWTDDQLREAVKESKNMTDVLRKLNLANCGNRDHLKRVILKLNIDTSHFETQVERCLKSVAKMMKESKLPLSEILTQNSTYNRCSI